MANDAEEEWAAPFGGDGEDSRSLAPFATTPDARIEEMIRLARVTVDDVVADLGAGDGAVLCLVWRHAKAKTGVGFEINDELVKMAKKRLAEEGCPAMVGAWNAAASSGEGDADCGENCRGALPSGYTIVNEDVLEEADLSRFTVVFTWLQPWAVELLAPKLAEAIRGRGVRVISYQWPITALEKDFAVVVGVTKNMYMYERRI